MAIELFGNLHFTSLSANPELLKNYPEEKKYFNKKIISYILIRSLQKELTAIYLGRLRLEIKKYLKEEMEEIDEVVKGIIN